MSEKKMIRINPETFATTHKTRKKTPRDPNKPIKIRSDRQNRSVKNSKRQLLKYIRDHQTRHYKQFSEQSNNAANNNTNGQTTLSSISIKPAVNNDSIAFDSDFASSLKYLESVAEQNKQSNISKLRHNTTLRHAPSRESLLFGSTLDNIIPYDAIDVNLPDVFSDITPTTTETVQLYPRSQSTVSVDPKYGCLKNGALPTYRMWKNQTMKTTTLHPQPQQQPQSQRIQDVDKHAPFVPSNNLISSFSYDGKPSPDNPVGVPRRQPDTPASQANPRTSTLCVANASLTPRSGVLTNGISVVGGNRPSHKPEQRPGLDASKPMSIIEDMRAHEPYRNKQKNRMKRMVKKQKQKRILRRTFRLGKSKHYPNVSVLVSNKTIRNQTTTRAQLLKQVPIEEIKKTLIKKGLIKVGSTAPADVLRKMYESVLLMCGDLQNHNPDNLLYNYFNAGDQGF